MWKAQFQELLREELAKRKAVDPAYSLRALARDLDVSVSALSRILNDDLDISPERAALVVAALNLSPVKRDRMLAAIGSPIKRENTILPADGAFMLTSWIYFAVLHFFDLGEESRTVPVIAQRLAVSEQEVEACLEKLLSAGFLARTETGEITKPTVHWSAGDAGQNGSIINFHRENLKLADRALSAIPFSERQFSSITFSGSQENMDWARGQIQDCLRRVSAMMEGKDQVYRLSVSLFPLDFQERN